LTVKKGPPGAVTKREGRQGNGKQEKHLLCTGGGASLSLEEDTRGERVVNAGHWKKKVETGWRKRPAVKFPKRGAPMKKRGIHPV